ncbi:hypothetical protein [Alicyclobacillus acidiphilus]|uniref:hypothetical protein n=1 Tax=Alicyclobacillus acidiphilus TaxID=182455 RepID=UPI0028935489|nr:hypothetical protein [Alicyclobacillus acidiphilus]
MDYEELKELLSDMEDRVRYDIHQVCNQLKDIQAEVNTLKQQASVIEKIIRIVDQNNAAALVRVSGSGVNSTARS